MMTQPAAFIRVVRVVTIILMIAGQAFAFALGASSAIETSLEAYCSSLKCDRGTFSTGDEIWFTGDSLNMLVESDSSLVSGEFHQS
jgi:hypothetical protein